jgi:hypothetical protein
VFRYCSLLTAYCSLNITPGLSGRQTEKGRGDEGGRYAEGLSPESLPGLPAISENPWRKRIRREKERILTLLCSSPFLSPHRFNIIGLFN